MLQTSTNITPKYSQETHYNYVKNSVFWCYSGSLLSPLLHYHYVSTSLTMQIPAETLSQSHWLCFIGKERDSETGFSYFGARYYDSDILMGWLSVDPMADKDPSLSPYAYCGWTRPTGADEHRLIEFNIANNPVRLVDTDGEDVWELNNEGRIVNRITTTEVDALHIVDDKENRNLSSKNSQITCKAIFRNCHNLFFTISGKIFIAPIYKRCINITIR